MPIQILTRLPPLPPSSLSPLPTLPPGISWFGCEGHGYTFTGLNFTTMDTILNFFVQHKFNTVRIPVSVAFALAPPDTKPNQRFVGKALKGKTIWEILGEAIDQAALRGLMVMLDMHTLGPQEPSDLWYDEQYKEADLLQAWTNIMTAYSAKWNVFALGEYRGREGGRERKEQERRGGNRELNSQ